MFRCLLESEIEFLLRLGGRVPLGKFQALEDLQVQFREIKIGKVRRSKNDGADFVMAIVKEGGLNPHNRRYGPADYWIGIAKRNPKDTPNPVIGMQVALTRALRSEPIQL